MGISLYEQYQRDTKAQAPADDSLYAQFQAEQRHKDYASGKLQRQVAAANATDPEQYELDKAPSYTDRLGMMAERAASTLPGGSAAMTGTRKLVTGEPWNDAAQHVAHDAEEGGRNAPGFNVPMLGRVTAADAPMAGLGFGKVLASAPKLVAKIGVPAASGAYSAATRATSPGEESFGSRVSGTATAGALGYALPAATGRVLRASGNVAGRTGLTDAVGNAADRLGLPKLANSIGTKGAVNRLLKDQEAIPDALGQKNAGTGESQLLAHAAETDKVSHQLFGKAVQDKQIINDPAVNEITANPLVQKAIGWAKSVRRLSGEDVPTRAEAGTRPSAVLDQYGNPSQVGTTTTVEALDPQLLHLAKQHVSDVLSGKLRGTLPGDDALSSAEAVAIEQSGVLNKLTSRLHDLSPAYKVADDYFSTRVNFQNGFEKGMELAGKPLKQAASQAATASPEAMQQWANEPNSWQRPRPELAKQRMEGLDAGHRAGLANQVRDVPLEQGGRGVLNKPPFGNAPDAVARRGTLSTGPALEGALGDLTRQLSTRDAVSARPDARLLRPWRIGNKPFDFLDTPKGEQSIRDAASSGRSAQPTLPSTHDALMALVQKLNGTTP